MSAGARFYTGAMKPKSMDPLRLDVASLATEGLSVSGHWPLADLSRLADSAMPEECPDAQVVYRAEGESRPVTGAVPEIWLHLHAHITLALCCQRCLGPVWEPVVVESSLRFAADEASAAALDAELEDDVLVLHRYLDLRELIEDELLLALPLVPRHEECPSPLPLHHGDLADAPQEDKPNPFAVLSQLKKGR